ncbi:MAG: putative cobalt transporter family protein, subunit CbtB [Dehalococcoidia bacterium]|nr:putative cobalt transporter family protein, subunit CbtB [Dehalococcoidia bacterium]
MQQQVIYREHITRAIGLTPLALALLGLFAIGLDQGQVLGIFQGDLAHQYNLLHEFFHDARHAAGFPCH